MPNHTLLWGSSPVTVIEKSVTISTNTDCRTLLSDSSPKTPVLILAERQTGGRGRQGKTFLSPPGGLYMSLLVPCHLPLCHSVRLTTAASVAVCRAIQGEFGLSCEVKWVNDLYVGGKKLCGILTEAVNDYISGTTEYVIVGIGINLTTAPPDVNATCMKDCLPATAALDDSETKKRLAYRITEELSTVFAGISEGDASYMEEYRRRSCVLGRWVRCIRPDGVLEGMALSIDDDGGLTVRSADGTTCTLTSGEITLRVTEGQFEKNPHHIIKSTK